MALQGDDPAGVPGKALDRPGRGATQGQGVFRQTEDAALPEQGLEALRQVEGALGGQRQGVPAHLRVGAPGDGGAQGPGDQSRAQADAQQWLAALQGALDQLALPGQFGGVLRLGTVEQDQGIAVRQPRRGLARVADVVAMAHAVQPVLEARRPQAGMMLQEVDMHRSPG
ncbi:hypothetical protein NCCP2165_05460 [Halomonas sp. NCCP-2165]|nr:hypothetical protein NCCP2165_05460 [Halomonas sp. NCCP-2165]